MTPYPLLYSPWHALGLSPLQDYTAQDIKRARRKASLHCHPDKRSYFGIDAQRWPTIDHIQESADYLLSLLSGQHLSLLYPPSDLGDFPPTFHPGKALGCPDVYSQCEKAGFVACEDCGMVIRTKVENVHLSSHQLHRCLCCQNLIQKEDCAAHYQTCDNTCQCLEIEDDWPEHIRHNHICPYCDVYIDKQEFLPQHIQTLHSCQCPDANNDELDSHIRAAHICCDTYHRDLSQHYRERHECACAGELDQFIHINNHHRCVACSAYTMDIDQHVERHHSCPYCEEYYNNRTEHIKSTHQCYYCHTLCMDPASHIQSDHTCSLCNSAHGDLAEHKHDKHYCEKCRTEISHLKSHLRKHCPLCTFHSNDYWLLQDHLESDHGLQYCRDCDASPSNKAQFLEHIFTHHWNDCPLCDRRIDGENLHHHLDQQHMWKKCESCPDPASTSAKGHFRNFHAEQICDFCPLRFYEAEMEKHLVEAHDWERCPYCSAVNEKGQGAVHVQNIHKPRPCPECRNKKPANEMAAHLDTVHGWKCCDFCHHMDSGERLIDHLDQCHAPCGDCDEKMVRSDLFQHRIDSHSWERCPHCSDSHPSSAMMAHIRAHQPRQCPHLECKKDIPEDLLPSHVCEVHAEKLCLFCGQQTTDLLNHIACHVTDSGQGSICHHCGEDVEQKNILFHAISHPRGIRLEEAPTNHATNEASIQHRACEERVKELESFIRAYLVQASQLLDRGHGKRSAPIELARARQEVSPLSGSIGEQEMPEKSALHENSTKGKEPCPICQKPRDKSNMARHRKTCEKSQAARNQVSSEEPRAKRLRTG